MSDLERRVLNLERLIQTVRLPALEVRVAALEQAGWQDSGSAAYTAELGERVWVITLIGCYGLGLDGETVEIRNGYGDGRVLGSATTDSSGVAVITTYGGDLPGAVRVSAAVSRFDAFSAFLMATTGSVTFASYTLTPDASHHPGPVTEPRPWGDTATLDDPVLSVSGVTLTYQAHFWKGHATANYSACGSCGSVSGISLVYVFDPAPPPAGDQWGILRWTSHAGCPIVGTRNNVSSTLRTISSTPGSFVASVTGLSGSPAIYCAGAPTWIVTGT